ncbi:response regulator [Paenibacillus sp. N4]|uniref:response regulator n=1 Tax=Paenibacillus vietnamensis TaxID=2590547 RepID=UPI001CD191BA|nr:response regulator [Paenibacillus vietnamensis]MCA0755795.1 response regulator [Paenibacillus vietnamensis]
MSGEFSILVVDDEKKERDGIETLIRRGGYNLRVLKANNGEDALTVLEQIGNVDILLTDIKMPFLDGLGLIRGVQDRKGEMFMILYSAYADFEYAQNAIALGVNKYLLKPINMEDFHSIMEEAIAWCTERETRRAESDKFRKLIEDSKQDRLEKQLQLLISPSSNKVRAAYDDVYELVPSFRYSPFIPIIICCEGTSFIEAFDEANEYSRKPFDFVYCLPDEGSFLVCLFGGQVEQGAGTFCDRLLRASGQRKLSPALVIVGRTLTSLEDLKPEYERMSSYADYYYFISSNTVVNVQKDALIESSHDVLNMSIEKIVTCVKVQNYAEAYSELDRLQSQIHNSRSYSQIFIKYIFTEMIKKISAGSGFFIKPEDFVNEIYSTGSLGRTMGVIEKIIRKIESKQNDSLDINRTVRMVKDLIAAEYGSSHLGLAYLADQANVTSAYLSALFKKETGQNISKYIADYRIEQAKYWLRTTNAKVSEIGEKVGIPNTSYFISIFRSKENVSPAQYREREEGR